MRNNAHIKQPTQPKIYSPVKGNYKYNNINHYTIAELSLVIHKLRKRIADKEKYITFLKTELEENNIEYKEKFRKLKQFKKEEDKDFSLDSLLKTEKNIKKKMRKRRRKADKGDNHPEITEPLEPKEKATVNSFVSTPERKESYPLASFQPNSEISMNNFEKEVKQVVEIKNIDPMEKISEEIYEEFKRGQEEKQMREEDKRIKNQKKFSSELYLRKVRKIQSSDSLYKTNLLREKELIYSINNEELDKLLSITSEEKIQEEIRRDLQKIKKTEDGSLMGEDKKKIIVEEKKKEEIIKESNKRSNKEENKEEVMEEINTSIPVSGQRKEEIEPPVYKEDIEEDKSFIMALHKKISEEIEKDEIKQKEEMKKGKIEENEQDEKEIDKILREEKEVMQNEFGNNELTYLLFSSFWKNNLKNEEFRRKKINRMKKILKELDEGEDKSDLRKHIAFAKNFH